MLPKLNVIQTTNSSFAPKKRGDIRDVLVVALPMLLSMSFDTFMTFIDRLFLSKLGPAEMNAALGAGAVQLALTMFFTGAVSYTTAMVAQRLGAKKRWDCARVFMQAVYLSLACVPLLYSTIPLGPLVFGLENLPADQLEYQKTYFNILMFGGIISLVRNAAPCFFSGIGETKIVMQAAFVGMIVNVVCNFVLIFGLGPIPALGVAGAAYGTLMGNAVSTVILFVKFFGKSCHRRFRTRNAFAFSWPLCRELLRKGIPSGVEMFLNMSAFQLLILMFHALGPAAATASSVMFNWDMVAYVPLMGLEVASTSLVGRYVGAKNGAAANRSTYSGLRLGWGYSAIIGVLFVFLPGVLTDVFQPDAAEASAEALAIFAESRPMGMFMLRFAALYIFVEVLLVIYAGALRGAGDTFWVMVASAVMNWFVALALYVAAYVIELPAHYAWIAVVAVYSTVPLIFWRRWKSGKWRKHVLENAS